MDIIRLRYFCTLAQTSHMRRAAELLHLSPPALSKAMRLLEDEVGYTLIQADGRGLLITEKGKRLAQRALPVLRAIEELERPQASTLEVEPLKVGTFEVFSTYFWGEAMSRHLKETPHTLYELVPGHIEEELARRRIDLGITYLPIPLAGLEHIKITRLEMAIYSGPSFNAAATPFAEWPFVVPVTPLFGSPTKAQGLDGWPEERVARKVRYRCTLMQSCLELLRRNLAVAYLPQFVVRRYNQSVGEKHSLRKLEAPRHLGSKPLTVYLVKRKGEEESASFKALAKALRVILK